MGAAVRARPLVAEGLIGRERQSDYFADRIRAELAFARARDARDPESLARHLNARGFLTRDGRRWTAEAVEAETRRPSKTEP